MHSRLCDVCDVRATGSPSAPVLSVPRGLFARVPLCREMARAATRPLITATQRQFTRQHNTRNTQHTGPCSPLLGPVPPLLLVLPASEPLWCQLETSSAPSTQRGNREPRRREERRGAFPQETRGTTGARHLCPHCVFAAVLCVAGRLLRSPHTMPPKTPSPSPGAAGPTPSQLRSRGVVHPSMDDSTPDSSSPRPPVDRSRRDTVTGSGSDTESDSGSDNSDSADSAERLAKNRRNLERVATFPGLMRRGSGGEQAEADAAVELMLIEAQERATAPLLSRQASLERMPSLRKQPSLVRQGTSSGLDHGSAHGGCFHIDENQRAVGTTKAAGEQHIAYLLRQFELWNVYINPSDGSVSGLKYDADHAVFKPEVNQAWLGVIAAVVFFGTWFPLHMYGGLGAADTSLIPMLAAVFVLYAIVYSSTGFALYQANSFVDGWNSR